MCAARVQGLLSRRSALHEPNAYPSRLHSRAPSAQAHQAKGVEQEKLKLEHSSEGYEQQGEDHRSQHLHSHPRQPEGCAAEPGGVERVRSFVQGHSLSAAKHAPTGLGQLCRSTQTVKHSAEPGYGSLAGCAPDSSMPMVLSAWRRPRSRSKTTALSCRERGGKGAHAIHAESTDKRTLEAGASVSMRIARTQEGAATCLVFLQHSPPAQS